MEIIFDKSSLKSLDKINERVVKDKIRELIIEAEEVETISEIKNVKKLQGFKQFYRIRIGDYRLGLELENNNSLRFIVVLHRKEIYKKFP